MAALSLGRPVVTTQGHLSEPFWSESSAVAIAPADELATTVLRLLADPARRAELGREAANLYRSRFAVEHTIRLLRESLPAPAQRRVCV